MKNGFYKFLIGFAAFCMAFTISGAKSQAAGDLPKPEETQEPYTYTVTFYAGNQGTFRSGGLTVSDSAKIEQSDSMIRVSNLKYGDKITFDYNNKVVLPEDSKYYVKGIRQSGRDNNTASQVSSSAITVTGDQDFVAAYGVKGKMVAYRVNYEDEDGNELVPSSTFYGNVGDKPVVAFVYVAGYEPQAYNLTKTLVEDESENVFTFVYRQGAGGTATEIVIDEGGNTILVPGGVTVLPGEGDGAAAGDADAGADGGAEDIQDEEVPQAPSALQDLDDESVPLANFKELIINSEGSFVYGASIIIGAAAAAALILMGFQWRKRRKNEGTTIE